MFVLGIDPGVTGAIATICLPPGRSPEVSVHDVPTLKVIVSRRPRDRADFHNLHGLMQALAALEPTLVVLEDIERGGVRPGQSGQVTLGRVSGALEMAAVACGLRIHLVPPATWKIALGVNAGKTEREKSDACRLAASRLFPTAAHLWPLVKGHNRAEAALIAWYGATKVLGVNHV